MTKENKFKIGLALQGIALSMDDKTLERNRNRLKQIEDIIIAEPTGEQEPKTGRWKRIGYDFYECSICGQDVMTGDICAYRHCHCCGTRMVSPQESEDKDAK